MAFNIQDHRLSNNSEHSPDFLYDVLYTSPTLPNKLMKVILSWRLYKYVCNDDIEKIHFQIYVHKKDQNFQRVFFRNYQNNIIEDNKLKTVTIGVIILFKEI